VKQPPFIEEYRFGRIVIDRQVYVKDVIILPDQVHPNWWRADGHRLAYEDLLTALGESLDVLVIGTGSNNRMRVPQEVLQKIESRGIRPLVMPTDKACETYNRLCKTEKVAAALHLTC
jgi:hypothetical protein